MSAPYPPRAPRKLYRSRTTKMIGGVCGGLADYLNMDPTLVRILTVVISLFTGVPIILYILALFLVPEEPVSAAPTGYPPVAPTPPSSHVWGPTGAPWEQSTAGPMPTWNPGPASQPPVQPAPWAATTDPVSPFQPTAPSEPVATEPFATEPVAQSDPTPSDPTPSEPTPSDPTPVEPTDPEPIEPDQPSEPQPIAPSEPEAPVVAPSDSEENQDQPKS